MRLYDFSPSESHAIENFGSAFRISPLTGLDLHGRVHCFYLEADGLVGRHETAVGQLFCVVAGTGWVSGSDDLRVPIRAGEAAEWTTGEMHEAGTDSGMTAIVLEGDFSVVAAARPSA